MPELIEQMYCSQQIVIPPKFPYILKRYCKAAIKTQPYDLLRWSFEYFKALAQRRPPPVKLRLEYPIYSTEGGLTRGCLKVLAQQLAGMTTMPISTVKSAWQGFCLDPSELVRILCLCDVYLRMETVAYLHFVAVAGGLLTKSLTHTMILLCETLTKEPDGGSAAIPLNDFLVMYKFLARIDASKDTKYYNGWKEGLTPEPEPAKVEQEEKTEKIESSSDESDSDDFWGDKGDMQKLAIINDHVARSARLSVKLNMPLVGYIERSPSIERMAQVDRENYMRDRKGRPVPDEEVDQKLRQLSAEKLAKMEGYNKEAKPKVEDVIKEKKPLGTVELHVYDEDEEEIPFEIYGDPVVKGPEEVEEEEDETLALLESMKAKDADSVEQTEAQKMMEHVNTLLQAREERRMDLEQTFEEIAALVDRFEAANYDLGMIAGRQMSTTSGEFIVQNIQKEIMAFIDDQIAVLPDPDLKKKKAKPEEVAMIRDLLENFIEENMEMIVPDLVEEEEEEQPLPDVTVVYAVPGIGPAVDEEMIRAVDQYAQEVAKVQADLFMPRNIRHLMCPPLEKFVEYHYDDWMPDKKSKKHKHVAEEEVPTGGVITD